MPRTVIVGVRVNSGVKKDGTEYSGMTLHCLTKSGQVDGYATEDVYINGASPLYKDLFGNQAKGSIDYFKNRYVTVYRTDKGYVDDVELGEKVQKPIYVGF